MEIGIYILIGLIIFCIGYLVGIASSTDDSFRYIADELADSHMENIKLKEELATAEWQLGNYRMKG